MALHVQSSFSGGEVDPGLQERTTFDRYQSGLKTGRNWIIDRTGRSVTRPGRIRLVQANLPNRTCIGYAPPNEEYWIEWGHQYFRIYDYDGDLLSSGVHSWTEDDLPYIRFTSARDVIFVTLAGEIVKVLNKESLAAVRDTDDYFRNPIVTMSPSGCTVTPSTVPPAGYPVEYLVTCVLDDGQETLAYPFSDSTDDGLLPIDYNQGNRIEASTSLEDFTTGRTAERMNVYRRPISVAGTNSAGAFGFIGSTTAYTDAATRTFTFEDLGQAADYTHNPPDLITKNLEPGDYLPSWACIYQQRLLLGLDDDDEAIIASRTGHLANFTREYPYSTDSALRFKASSGGHSKVYHAIESDGLVVFASTGIFLHSGILSPTNMALVKKGDWVSDPDVPPLGIPGGCIFIDFATSTVRELAWSEEAAKYTGDELSVYSNHLFRGKKVTSWGFEKGDLGVLWVSMDDGNFLSFTWEPSQKMLAWMRHDSDGLNVEQVIPTGKANKTLFLVEKDGVRYFELTVPRYISGATLESDPEAYMGHSIAAYDSMLSFRTKLNDSLVGSDFFTVSTTVEDDWGAEGTNLRLSCGGSNIFTSGTYGAEGTILRHFDEDGNVCDLKVMERESDNSVLVQPSCEFPSDEATAPRIYATGTTFSVPHLAGEQVGVIVDGGVVSAPKNPRQYPPLTVSSGGVLTLPTGMRGAIVHIGRPYIADLETLDIDTVEQRPVLLESQIVNKVYVKTLNSLGLHVGSKFPANNAVTGMTPLDDLLLDETDEVLQVDRFQPPSTRRHEVSIDGDWKSNGRICIRQVDGVHAEILSIIPDSEELRRSMVRGE